MSAVSNRARVLVLSLVAALAFAVVPAAAANATGPGTMALTLTSESGVSPFTFVEVQGPEGQQFASFDGTTATLGDLALGDYTATVGASPSSPGGSVSFTLTAAEPDYVGELVLPPWPTGTSSISGTIVDDHGVPLEGAQVNLISDVRPFPSVFTASDGTYVVANLPAGHYFVSGFAFGYFSRSTALTLAEGEAAVVDLVLPIRDATVSGRLVDGAGNPIADVFVEARNGQDFAAAMSGADGTFRIFELSAGEWTIVGGGPATPWLPSQVVLTLESGENADIGDLLLEPRTTADIAGSVLHDFDPFPMSIEGICATLLNPDGSAVPGQAVITGVDGTYFFADLAPGSYTVFFNDCDPGRVPPFGSVYYGDSATLAGATIVTAAAGEFLNLDTVTLHPQSDAPEPTHDATKPKAHDLTSATYNDISAPATVTQNESFVIDVGAEYAGQWVSVWLYTPTKQLGEWHRVAADGIVQVTVPKKHPAGTQELVVQDSHDDVIGWTTLRIRKA